MKEFAGHLAFITGGASGIGEQICRDLADQGASVIVADIQLKAATDLVSSLPTGNGRLHIALQLDVSKKSQVEDALAHTIKTYGRPADMIVNAAGICGEGCSLEDVTEELLDQVMAVNFKGTFLVTQILGKALLDSKDRGSIVNISSVLAYTTGIPRVSPYCSSKAAVMQFTKVVAKEWGPRGIRINSIHPGLIDTPMTQRLKNTPNWENFIKRCSLKRIGKPSDVSSVVLFALSNRSSFMTGAQLEVSGQGSV